MYFQTKKTDAFAEFDSLWKVHNFQFKHQF